MAQVLAGHSQVLVLRGEAGIGKTALLEFLVDRAAGCRVARAAGVESEMELANACLHQLCSPYLDRVGRLPAPQQDAPPLQRPLDPAGEVVVRDDGLIAEGSLPVTMLRSPDTSGPGGSGRYLLVVNSGFGVQANYTYVNSGLKYDNGSVGEQFALVGLGDSANLVGIFENDKWNVRAAYNWRDEFLSGRFDGAGANPNYTEAYGQLDLSVGYKVNDQFTIQFEGINLTDETQRIHGRHENQVLFATQYGPRYAIGFRYNFE